MKINKLEIEMTTDEKKVWDKIRSQGSCTGISCDGCPIGAGLLRCAYTRGLNLRDEVIQIKVIQPPLVLTEGMDCRDVIRKNSAKENV